MVGLIVSLLRDSGRARLSIASLDAWIRMPVRLGQIILLLGERGTALGFASWAYVSAETAARLGDASHRPPDPEDWNDGTLLWIVDVVAPHGNLAHVVSALRQRHLGAHRAVAFADRRTGYGRTIRVTAQPTQPSE